MKRTIYLLVWVFAIAIIPQTVNAAMDSYCSAPPYVTRSIAPNIMILMDNSLDMLNPAYTDVYTPNATKDNYAGYFKPQSCYAYSTNKFVEWSKSSLAACTAVNCTSYTSADSCPSAAPFRGNLLDWATTSKYDILEKVLIGGNSVSKQGNAHTLLSISGDWSVAGVKNNNTFDGCIFQVNSANLTITEATSGACALLDSPAAAIAFWTPQWWKNIFASMFDNFKGVYSYVLGSTKGLFASLSEKWEQTNFISRAWALAVSTTSTSLNGTVGTSYSITVSASGGTGSADYTWSGISAPAWFTSATPTLSGLKNKDARWTGTPTSAGPFTFSGTVTKSAGETNNFSYTITISCPSPPQINTTSPLTGGTVGTAYSLTVNGSNGITPYSWSATGLPAGLSICAGPTDTTWNSGTLKCVVGANSYDTGTIYGTPTTAGPSSVVVSLTDAAGSCQTTVSKPFSITIATSSLTIISTSPLPDGAETSSYFYTLLKSGGTGSYTWSLSSGSLPSGLSLSSAGVISGTPTTAGAYSFTVSLNDGITTVTKDFSLTIIVGGATPTITTTSPLPDAEKGTAYSTTVTAIGGTGSYTWSATGLPTGFSINSSTGEISAASPTQANVNGSPYTVIITVTDNNGTTATTTLNLNVVRSIATRSSTFNVKVDLIEETFTDGNGNDICCDSAAETSSLNDANGNGQWDGKQGIFQKFWDTNTPKARWGLTKFGKQGATVTVIVDESIPAGNSASFYTTIQNATPTDSSPLAQGLYGDINYYGFSSANFSSYVSTSYTKGNSDPIDNVPCRKNFILVLSSGSDVGPASGKNFSDTSCTSASLPDNSAAPLVQNGCFGYKTDLRSLSSGKQNVYTYIVNTMGTTNNKILEDAALAGHGKYYDASNASNLEQQLKNAFTDILGQAASGTAVSVLTTSSRGVGSMVQAYFLPTKLEGSREVSWTGYTQNIWIDPKDNLREDTVNDFQLKLDSTVSGGDNVIKLYFDSAANETKVATFTTDGNGENGTLASCSAPNSAIKAFSDVKYLWEAGKKLALQNPSGRNLRTATKVRRGASEIYDFTGDNAFTSSNITNDTSDCSGLAGDRLTLCSALDRDTDTAAYDDSAANIVRYVRGECLETTNYLSSDPDAACGATAGSTYRDRRLTVSGGATNGNVWKLGDIISSTPKVFANTPLNTYHIDYGDSTYFNYVAVKDSNSNGVANYKEKSSMAFVGANDGVLHAFRVGYLKDTGLDVGVKALFKNFFGSPDTTNDQLGEEVWGYVPFNAFPYLKYLANTGYCHIYYNDLSVRLVDASIGGTLPTDIKDADGSSWKTVLIGGMRFGGGCSGTGANPTPPATVSNVGFSAYYAIDITDPENPVPLWEFSDADMGYATTFPSVIRTGAADKNGFWYAVIGSGSKQMPKSNTDINRNSTDTGHVYILNLKTGELVKKIALDHAAIVGDILAIDADKDYSSEKIYFGTAYLDTTWKGKLVGIKIPNQDLSTWTPNLSTWTEASPSDIKYLFADSYPFTASPDAARDADGNIWVYAGSGKYYSDIDDSDTSTQLFLGIKDADSGITYPKAASGLTDRTNTDTTGTVTGTSQVCMYDSASPAGFKFKTVVTSINPTSATVTASPVGWFISLTANGTGERVITRPLAVGGLVDFLTYKPDASDPCSYGGSSFLYAVGYTTGVAPTNIAIMSPDAVVGGTVKKGILLGPGAPPTGEAIIIPPPKEGEETLKKKIQIATGVIVEAENTPVTSVISKVVHWLRK